jgi:hypothetical protein
MGRRFRYEYGSGPLHLVALATTFAVAGYALAQVLEGLHPVNFAAWFLIAIVAHDIVLMPFYSLLGAIAYRGLGVARGRPVRVAALNHVRVPAMLAGLLLLLFFPLILGVDAERFEASSGETTEGYLERWLGITAAAFAISGIAFAVRVRRLKRHVNESLR